MTPRADLRRVFVANRGEIALRVIRACERLGLETVLGVSEADRASLPARRAGRVVTIGPPSAGASYLDVDAVVTAAVGTGCDALHPGYGFLAENPALPRLCAEHGVSFVGPSAETIAQLGDKITARRLAAAAGVPVSPGRDGLADVGDARRAAAEIGYPLLLKATAGGGGRGMQIVRSDAEIAAAFETATAEARAAFGDPRLYAERFVGDARHVEVQILGDGQGDAIHLGERDCTVQRRHQKLIEEGPATAVPERLVAEMRSAAVQLARSVQYLGAGTVEFIYDTASRSFYFLEVNTRIQVEHPVTEALTGVDLVAEQLHLASGRGLSIAQDAVRLTGHAIECRINAEDPLAAFCPAPGVLRRWRPPEGPDVRVDTHCFPGYAAPPYYDSLLAKLIVTGPTRLAALDRLSAALRAFEVSGVPTTLPFLRVAAAHPDFRADAINTKWVDQRMATPEFMALLQEEAAS